MAGFISPSGVLARVTERARRSVVSLAELIHLLASVRSGAPPGRHARGA